ncbi:hypothetical protein Syun_014617 [Stephania yunnanensis]|uniref:Uncharacterized protein n=1 Tax=Stephania yunnanensis TaxID=152371 RepID=A0AAP0JM10_9MAGN
MPFPCFNKTNNAMQDITQPHSCLVENHVHFTRSTSKLIINEFCVNNAFMSLKSFVDSLLI